MKKIAGLLLLLSACQDPPTRVEITADVPAPVVDAGKPPCVRENCYERPRGLLCDSPGAGSCTYYRIIYGHHCDCIEWGPQ